jgi:hypothetical protein
MAIESPSLQFLKEQINGRIAIINQSRLFYRKIAFWTYLSITILAASSTIILGLNIKCFEEGLRITALILSGLITILSAYNTFFDNKQMWIANNNALNAFYKLIFDIQFAETNAQINEVTILQFKKDYQHILDTLNATWTNSRLK